MDGLSENLDATDFLGGWPVWADWGGGDGPSCVAVFPASHSDVETVGGGGVGNEGVAGVYGSSLRAVDGARVAEVYVLGDVLGGKGQQDVLSDWGYEESAVFVDGADLEGCTVDYFVMDGFPSIAPGDDFVSESGLGCVVQGDGLSVCLDFSGFDEAVLGGLV